MQSKDIGLVGTPRVWSLAHSCLFSFIFQKLPATANSKIIDSWLLFCVIMIVVSIVLHTVIASLYKGKGTKCYWWNSPNAA